MNTVNVKAEHDYSVLIGCEWSSTLIEALANRTRVAIIVSSSFVPDLSNIRSIDSDVHIFEVPDGEDAKSPATLMTLWNWLGAAGFTRSDVIVGIGGGAITDLAGFAAATWLRGVEWIAVPTSLAGMVDAAVGGKTGVNSDYGKNLIGSFHSPQSVLIDLAFLTTLSKRDFCAGMAEVIKCGFIEDAQILKVANSIDPDNFLSMQDALLDLVTRAVAVKAKVVSADFKESFARESLNYGHTLGHAIEMNSKYQMRHGEAVAIGMVFVAELARARGLITDDVLQQHRDLLNKFDLPISYDRQAWQKLAPLLALDKKARGKTLRFVAINGVGSTVRLEDLTSDELDAAYERISA